MNKTAHNTFEFHYMLFDRNTGLLWLNNGGHHWTSFNDIPVDVSISNVGPTSPIFAFVSDAEAFCETHDLDLRIVKVKIVIGYATTNYFAVVDYEPSTVTYSVVGQSRTTAVAGSAYLYTTIGDALNYMVNIRHYGDTKPFVAPVHIELLDELSI